MLSLIMSLFLLNQQVQIVDCGEQSVRVIEKGVEKEIDFFNLLFYPTQQEKVCNFILKGKKVELIEEPRVDHAYYIVVDGILLQKVAIQQEWARINLRNPQFLYADQMKYELSEMVVVQPKAEMVKTKAWFILGLLFLMICGMGWILTKL